MNLTTRSFPSINWCTRISLSQSIVIRYHKRYPCAIEFKCDIIFPINLEKSIVTSPNWNKVQILCPNNPFQICLLYFLLYLFLCCSVTFDMNFFRTSEFTGPAIYIKFIKEKIRRFFCQERS